MTQALCVEPSEATLRFLAAPRRHLIGARWVSGGGERQIEVENPARGQIIATIDCASIADLDAAVAAARMSFESGWGRLHARDRARILFRFADLIEGDAERLAQVMTLDNGMPLASSRAVIKYLAVELIRYYAGWATKISGEAFKPVVGSRDQLDFLVATLREPIGVVGAIVPWNAPAGMLALKIAPALAAGCTLVLKTAELAPLVGEIFAELLLQAGAPPGTLNVLHGYGEDLGAAIAEHGGIDKITFTGSTAVGRSILRAAAGNLKKVTLELGGKSPVVIFPDADLGHAIPAASMACYLSSGQACMAGSRLFVHEEVHDQVVEGIRAHVMTLPVGDGMRLDTVIGPLISAKQKQRVLRYLDFGLQDGAKLEFGSELMEGIGHFVRPALFTQVTAGMRIAQEEIFGPILSVFRFNDEITLLRDINGLRYGLSGSVWTKDIQRALRLAQRIDSGQVAINYHAAMSPETPFGGNKESGWGREFGREGLEAYLKTKAISINVGVARRVTPAYFSKYPNIALRRDPLGILELRLHSRGGPLKFSAAARGQLLDACFEIGRDRDNRVIIFTGTGDQWCAEFETDPAATVDPALDLAARWDRAFWEGRKLLQSLLDIDAPCIAAVNGPALIHSEYLLTCDIILAAETAAFQDLPHLNNGVPPTDGVHVLWPYVLGPRGRYFLLTQQKLSAAQALDLGVCHEVLPQGRLIERAYELAQMLARQPTATLRYARVGLTQRLKKLVADELALGLAVESLAAVSKALDGG